ncbi:MAG TPA: TonB-dependent receptor [Opitutaceae bacterium]
MTPYHPETYRSRRASCPAGTVFALLTLLAGASPVLAQETQPSTGTENTEQIELEEFRVVGVQASLIGAQEIKQNATQVVDSIVAEDIGKLPDNTVADALQRIPGIQVGRGNGEVSTVLIRGLPNLGTTLNGNEIFTGTGRGVALQDIPAELVAGVDVYKSSSPEQTEGGIAGLIDIRLRRPLDFQERTIAGGVRAIYGENADRTGYVGSLLASERWKTNQGDIGVMYSGAYQQRYFVDQTAFNFLFEPVNVPDTLVPGQTQLQLPFTQGSLIIPGDRARSAHNISLQWRPNSNWEFYTDFLNTGYRNENQVHFLIGFPRFGAFTAATVHPGTNVPITTTSVNNFHLTSTQAFKNRTDGYQAVFGAKWNHESLRVSSEILYNWNSVKNQVLIVDTQFAPPTPGTFTFTYNDNSLANQRITNADITSGNNFFLWGLFDNRDYSSSEQKAWRADAEYLLPSGLLSRIKGGLRFTTRSARFRGSSRNDIAPVGGRGLVPSSSVPGFGSVNPDGPLDDYQTPHWFGADPDYLYNNPDDVRGLFGLAPGAPGFNPTLGFTDDEDTAAGYLVADYSSTLGNKPFSDSIGARVVRTSQKLTGFLADETPINSDESQVDVLPVLNARLKLSEILQLRFAAGRTITRPNFSDLNPATTLNAPTTTGGAAGTGSGGNPELQTVTSDNFDLSLEYYFAKSSYVALTGFDREIDGYVQSFAQTETIGGTPYIVVRPRNSGQGRLYGFEASYQHFPDFGSGFLKGLGWQANYTYIEGETDAPDTAPGAAIGALVRKPYAQVSKHNFNIIAIYEREAFSARLAFNYRGKFTDTFDGPNAPGSPLRVISVKPTETLDFSASYQLNENLTLTLDITNILNSEYQDYFFDSNLYPRDTRAYDRTASLGLRFKF